MAAMGGRSREHLLRLRGEHIWKVLASRWCSPVHKILRAPASPQRLLALLYPYLRLPVQNGPAALRLSGV